jgi:beta-glucosidase
LAATWDSSLSYRYASGVGKEFRDKGANVLLGPSIDIARVGRGGRNGESLCGEDPQLCKPLVAEYVKGLKSQGIAAVAKHFALNTQETNRNDHNNNASERALWEVYYAPFQAAIDAGLASVMCSYNGVGGIRSCENPKLLEDDLKGRMGFRGWVMSDWWAMQNRTAGSTSGLDMNMAGNVANFKGFLPQWNDIDYKRKGPDGVHDSVRRILWGMLSTGAYDTDVCVPALDVNCKDLTDVDVTSEAHTKLAQEVAAASVVMLQNDGDVLPMSRSARVLVLGSACSAAQVTTMADLGWNQGDYYVIGGSGRILTDRTVSVFKGLLEASTVAPIQGPTEDNVNIALEALLMFKDQVDVVIACGGATSGEDEDRQSLELDQHDFLVQLAAQNAKLLKPAPLVIITMSSGSILTDFRTNANAVLSVFLTGQETGRALADVLYGDVNPSARLPLTFPLKEDDMQPVCQEMHCDLTEGLNVGWRNLIHKPVAFPFGHGLSYTSFGYSWAVPPLSTFNVSDVNAAYEVSVLVHNKGTCQGREVLQLYLRFPRKSGEPEKLLRGFHRTSVLLPGRSEEVTFKLHLQDLSIWSEQAHKWQLVFGTFGVDVGASSRDTRLTTDFNVVP